MNLVKFIKHKGVFMATSEGFKDFVLEQLAQCAEEYLEGKYDFGARKMFGEYVVYIVDSRDFGTDSGKKVLFLLCNENVFIKKFECLDAVTREYGAYFALGFPFDGAREHYILDIENLELMAQIIKSAMPFLPTPKPRKARRFARNKY